MTLFHQTSLVFALIFCVSAFTEETKERKIQLAVLPLSGSSTLSAEEIQVISDRFVTELIQTEKFTLLERGEVDKILTEQGFSQSGACTSADCQVEIGQLLGVEKLITGTLGKVEDIISMNLKMIDVQSGKIDKSHAIDISGGMKEVLTKGCRRLAALFSGKDKNPAESSALESTSSSRIWLWTGIGLGTAVLAGGIFFLLQDEPSKNNSTIENTRIINRLPAGVEGKLP